MFCVSCGAENPDAAKFCHKCGTAMVGSQPAATPAAAPVAAAPAPAPPPPPPPASPNPKPAAAAVRAPATPGADKGVLHLIGGLIIAGVLIALVILVVLNGLGTIARIVLNIMPNGAPGVVVGIILILFVIGIVGTIVSWLLKPLRGK